MFRTVRPKLSLTVPTITSPTTATRAPKSPFPFTSGASPLSSPTMRNTALNQRTYVSLSPLPSIATTMQLQDPPAGAGKGCMKKGAVTTTKKISFSKEASVNLISPMPADYHGSYRKMSKDEIRWGCDA